MHNRRSSLGTVMRKLSIKTELRVIFAFQTIRADQQRQKDVLFRLKRKADPAQITAGLKCARANIDAPAASHG
jgi:hypothetical protein